MRIKQLRTARKWSQNELAKRASISREYVARLEGGLQDPSVGIALRLAAALGVSLTTLVGDRKP